jgi:DNA-binding beta-propeller fold protein YncE
MSKNHSLFTGFPGMVCIAIAAFSFSQGAINAQTNPSQYKILNRIHIDGDGGWDCLTADDATNFLYVSHSSMVQVVDCTTGKLAGRISNTKGVHGIAVAAEFNKGFITCGKEDSITVFDLKTFTVLGNIAATGKGPDAIIYDNFSHLIFAFNGDGNNATVIDPKSDKVVATIALEGRPEFPISDEHGKVYINIEDKSSISVIDSKKLTVEKTWPIAPGEEPSGLAMDVENQILFAVCHNKIMVIADARTGKVMATVPIGERVDGAAFDPILKRAYSSNGDGTLTVVQEEKNGKFTVLENIATQRGARTIALNGKTHHLFLPTAEFEPNPDKTSKRPLIKPDSFVILEVAPK